MCNFAAVETAAAVELSSNVSEPVCSSCAFFLENAMQPVYDTEVLLYIKS